MARKYILSFNSIIAQKPVVYSLIKDYGVRLNILKAGINPENGGFLLVELDGSTDEEYLALQYMKASGVYAEPFEKRICFDSDKCIDCGACTGVCPTKALSLDRQTKELRFEHSKCVACGFCTKSCPLGLFDLNWSV